MTNPENSYSRRYEIDNGVYDKVASHPDFKKIHGEIGDSLLVRKSGNGIFLIEKNHKTNKEIIKIHSEEPDAIQSRLEEITGVKLSQYRVHENENTKTKFK